MNNYTVWVSGVEVNDYLLNKEQAEKTAQHYKELGYDEVQIGEY